MSDIDVVRKTVLVVSRDEPAQGGELVNGRVQHSEDPSWESKIWSVDAISRSIDHSMELSERRRSEVRPGNVIHQAKMTRYTIIGVAYCLDEPPDRNVHRVGVFYRAQQRSPHGHGFYWFRPLEGYGGWFEGSNQRDRFVRADKEQVAV